MVKHIDLVKLLVEGDGYGANTARFTYRVCDVDDNALRKVVNLEVAGPQFGDTVDEFFDGYVAVMKSNEGIS